MTVELVRYERARQALIEAKTVDEVKNIRDQAVAMQAYAKQALDPELINYATEIRFRAERRAGEILREMKEAGTRRGQGGKGPSVAGLTKLRDLGVSKVQSWRWQKLSSLAQEDFERRLAIAQRQAFDAVDGTSEQRSAEKKARRAAHEEELATKIRALPNKRYGLILADPEWRFVPWSEETGNDRSASNHYATSALGAILKRDVPSIAADDCVLALWATVPMLPQALEVMEAWGFCVGVGTRVLTADLRWVPAETLQVGDPLLSFSEYPMGKCRRYGWAQVTGNGIRRLPSCRITLEDGRQLIASEDHPWLIRASTGLAGLRGSIGGGMQWCKTIAIKRTLEDKRRTRSVELPQLAPVRDFDESYASGFLAGSFDGEGSLRGGKRRAASSLSFAQRDNVMLEAVQASLSEKGFVWNTYGYGYAAAKTLHLLGGKLETLRFLMQMRPPRLLAIWHKRAPNWSIYNTEKARVVAVEQIGLHECSTLSTSSGTYIAEGFGAHNTYRSHCVWLKNKAGTGYWFRNTHELLLIGVKGQVPAPAPGTQWESAWDSDVGEHSEKPELAYEMLEAYFPNLPKIELNARQKRDGWDAWGADAPVDLVTDDGFESSEAVE